MYTIPVPCRTNSVQYRGNEAANDSRCLWTRRTKGVMSIVFALTSDDTSDLLLALTRVVVAFKAQISKHYVTL